MGARKYFWKGEFWVFLSSHEALNTTQHSQSLFQGFVLEEALTWICLVFAYFCHFRYNALAIKKTCVSAVCGNWRKCKKNTGNRQEASNSPGVLTGGISTVVSVSACLTPSFQWQEGHPACKKYRTSHRQVDLLVPGVTRSDLYRNRLVERKSKAVATIVVMWSRYACPHCAASHPFALADVAYLNREVVIDCPMILCSAM